MFAEADDGCEKRRNECDVMRAMRWQSDLSVEAGDAWQHQVLISVGGEVMCNISPITEITLLFPAMKKKREI